jgi:N-acetylglucosaminyl-diphospho-decaprenol L-rhamnosyltransferase
MAGNDLTVMLPVSSHVDTNIDVTVVVVSYNTAHLLDRMFAALEAARRDLMLQIIVIDNASKDDSADILRKRFSSVELIENSVNVGFGRANNQALALAGGRYLLLLNTDAFVASDTLVKTVKFMDSNPDCGVLGVKLVGSDGTLQPSCRYFPTPWNIFIASVGLRRAFNNMRFVDDMSWDHASVRECDWVPGCYYLVRREVIESIGLFDPRYFVYCEEVDHCRAVRQAGWSVVYYPFTEVVHLGGESAKSDKALDTNRQISSLQIESELLYFRKHYGTPGVAAAVFLGILADVVEACKALVRRLDTRRAATAMRHAGTTIKLLVDTKLASRSTR